jgi:hypothetical protein
MKPFHYLAVSPLGHSKNQSLIKAVALRREDDRGLLTHQLFLNECTLYKVYCPVYIKYEVYNDLPMVDSEKIDSVSYDDIDRLIVGFGLDKGGNVSGEPSFELDFELE